MENKKKMIFNVLFLFLVFAATIYGCLLYTSDAADD